MRLWHKDLIPYLPKKQLLSQWRECCAIAKSISEKGTPNHILVNKIMDYPIEHFAYYATLVSDEMESRGYKCDYSKFSKWIKIKKCSCTYDKVFKNWHNGRYLMQCFLNLQEKYDCGSIPEEEWNKVVLKVTKINLEGGGKISLKGDNTK